MQTKRHYSLKLCAGNKNDCLLNSVVGVTEYQRQPIWMCGICML